MSVRLWDGDAQSRDMLKILPIMPRTGSLILRVFLAIGLMIGFYTLAIGIVGLLLYIPYAEVVYWNRIDLRLAFFCVTGAAVVLWSVVPRPDRFEAPGPELRPADHPQLFALIESVRTALDQAPPKQVYLIADVNAWVAQRGGLMGFGSRRVLALGLPLLQVLTVDELRAVMAHEFGHYHGGDTMLGAWIQKTRMGILRTLANLGGRLIRLPFTAYARLFCRITNAVSRHQEYAADAIAARTAGAAALIEGLKKIHRASVAFGVYWRTEYAPALGRRVRPPLAAGLAQFLAHSDISARLDDALQQELATANSDPYDTHPPLADRCDALARLDSPVGSRDPRPAIALLSGVDNLERELLSIAVNPELEAATAVSWREIPECAWVPEWRDTVSAQKSALARFTVGDVVALLTAPAPVARLVQFPSNVLPDTAQRADAARSVIASALAAALADSGWRVEGDIGDPIACVRGEDRIEPFLMAGAIQAGTLSDGIWQERCRELGISDLPLSPERSA